MHFWLNFIVLTSFQMLHHFMSSFSLIEKQSNSVITNSMGPSIYVRYNYGCEVKVAIWNQKIVTIFFDIAINLL